MRSAVTVARARQQAHDRKRRDRFARAGFADDAERLAGVERKREAVDGRNGAVFGAKCGAEIVDLQQRHARSLRLDARHRENERRDHKDDGDDARHALELLFRAEPAAICDSTRPPIEPVRPSCLVVCTASKKTSTIAAMTKMPAMPWVSHGHVLRRRTSSLDDRHDGRPEREAFGGMAPLGQADASAVGMALAVAAASRSGNSRMRLLSYKRNCALFTTARLGAPAREEATVPEAERLAEPVSALGTAP